MFSCNILIKELTRLAQITASDLHRRDMISISKQNYIAMNDRDNNAHYHNLGNLSMCNPVSFWGSEVVFFSYLPLYLPTTSLARFSSNS